MPSNTSEICLKTSSVKRCIASQLGHKLKCNQELTGKDTINNKIKYKNKKIKIQHISVCYDKK